MDNLEENFAAEAPDNGKNPYASAEDDRKISYGHGVVPEISSYEQATGYIESIIDYIAPWPETVLVMRQEEIKGCLVRPSSDDFTLNQREINKATAIFDQVLMKLHKGGGLTRIPVDLVLVASNHAAMYVHSTTIYQVIGDE